MNKTQLKISAGKRQTRICNRDYQETFQSRQWQGRGLGPRTGSQHQRPKPLDHAAHYHSNACTMCVWKIATVTKHYLSAREKINKINKLFTDFGSVRIVEHCYLGIKNFTLRMRPWASFLRPRSQFFTITGPPCRQIAPIYILGILLLLPVFSGLWSW